ncbi:hypothetical protein HO639_01155 [Streptococcus suis]|uniref:Uncharacterized protein n=1 Tax=Streptococcus suis TaxID=1307 RepID=A0A0Z8CHG0_STRSU|nr:hypothetical protein [Streptococcus suis]QBX21393.1 hypothetical protein Javan573_0006 [Streptococcus phage Javan573]NQH67512.1 hypothetical protein [Streptococcus suis]NQI05519.1 hypothetical protein [Streptococcus suis]NQP43209.1 hypothetical protein [Streptococcus suis]CYU02813.1 Uncharacterised protein [Streptococcus suis]
MYNLLAEWADQCPITVKLKDSTVIVFDGILDVHDDCIELLEKDTGDIYILQKEDILFAKINSSDIPEA